MSTTRPKIKNTISRISIRMEQLNPQMVGMGMHSTWENCLAICDQPVTQKWPFHTWVPGGISVHLKIHTGLLTTVLQQFKARLQSKPLSSRIRYGLSWYVLKMRYFTVMQMKHQGVQWCEWISKPWQRQWLEPWSPVWFRFQEVHTQGNKPTDLGRLSPWGGDNHQELREELSGTRRALCIGMGCDEADSLQEFTTIHLCNLRTSLHIMNEESFTLSI